MTAKAATLGEEPMNTIEQHRLAKKTDVTVHLGAMAMAGWSSGKMLTEKEYTDAITAFLKADTGGVHRVKRC